MVPLVAPFVFVKSASFFQPPQSASSAARRSERQNGPLALSRAVALLRQALAALGHAHACRFVHRDVKPSNPLISQEGERERLRIADFGLARLYQVSQLSGLTLTGEVGGTIAFMPPEQILDFRNVLPASDQYSAAASLYNLLSGRHIHDFKGTTERRLHQILEADPVPIKQRRSDLPDDLAGVLHRALARRPDKRWPSADAFSEALRPFEA